VLVGPDLEAGNMRVKILTFRAGPLPAGFVLGASVPITRHSHAGDPAARLSSRRSAAALRI
jgi:phosphate acetyltransferase